MPPVSQEQRRLMRWAAANPKAAKARGINPAVAREFNNADPGGKLPETVKSGSRAQRRYGGQGATKAG